MIKDNVLETVKRYEMLGDCCEVTVALSGGADSVALFNLLYELKDELGISLSAAHLNHMIRGEEADSDEEFVRRICKEKGVKLYCKRVDVPAVAKAQGKSLELAAREVRYEFLNEVSPGKVATAHTASDNIETVLLNMTRGSGLKGICGIPPVRGRFVRPLINCTRVEIEEYCKEKNLDFVTDSTNLSDDYTRNKIRHNIIPVLKQINPSVETAFRRASNSLAEDEEFIGWAVEKYICENTDNNSLKTEKLKNIHISVSKRVVKTFSERIIKGLFLDEKHINAVLEICLKGGRTEIPGNLTAVVKKGVLSFEKNGCDKCFDVSFEYSVNNLIEKDKKIHSLLLNNAIDCDKIVGKPIIRKRQPGDSIRLNGKRYTKTLKKLFCELGIPLNLRGDLPVVSDDDGIIWVYGVGVAERCAVNEKTEKVLIINTVERIKNDTQGVD